MEILEACGGGKAGIRCLPAGGEEEAGEAVIEKEGVGEEPGGGWLGVVGFLDVFEVAESRFSAGEVDESSIELRAEVVAEEDRPAPAVALGEGGSTGRERGGAGETATGDAILMKILVDGWRERQKDDGCGGGGIVGLLLLWWWWWWWGGCGWWERKADVTMWVVGGLVVVEENMTARGAYVMYDEGS